MGRFLPYPSSWVNRGVPGLVVYWQGLLSLRSQCLRGGAHAVEKHKKERHSQQEQAGASVGPGFPFSFCIKLVMDSQPRVMPLGWKTDRRELTFGLETGNRRGDMHPV